MPPGSHHHTGYHACSFHNSFLASNCIRLQKIGAQMEPPCTLEKENTASPPVVNPLLGYLGFNSIIFLDGKLMHCTVPPSLFRDNPSELIFMKGQLLIKQPLGSRQLFTGGIQFAEIQKKDSTIKRFASGNIIQKTMVFPLLKIFTFSFQF